MAAMRNTLTYLVPDSLAVQPGQRVQVPLGTRRATGIVLGGASPLPPGIEARPILRVLDAEPVLTPELIELGLWIADYYVAPIGEVFRSMLPLRPATRRVRSARLTDAGRSKLAAMSQAEAPGAGTAAATPSLLLAPSTSESDANSEMSALLNYLTMRGNASIPVLRQKFPEAFSQALKAKWLAVDEVERDRTQRQAYAVRIAGPVPEEAPRLSPVARRIMEVLRAQPEAIDHRELLEAARADLAVLKRMSAAGIIELAPAERAAAGGEDLSFLVATPAPGDEQNPPWR